jgi:multiple sugar transport system substrate-binding protein
MEDLMNKSLLWKIVLLCLMASLILSGCGAKPTEVTAPPAAEPTKAPVAAAEATKAPVVAQEATKPPVVAAENVKIRGTVWVSQAELDALNALTAEYLKTHPNITVEWVNISGGGPYGRDKLQTMIAGNDAPDLMMLNTGQFEGLAARGALLPLDSYAGLAGFDKSAFWEIGFEGSKYNGKLYGLPRDISDVILYYNKDMFDAAGLAYPTADWTYEDMAAAAEKLTIDKNGDGKIDQWGFGVNNAVWDWVATVWANGGDVLSADRKTCMLTDPKTVEALEYYFEKMQKFSPPPGALPEMAWSGDWFTTQSIAMGNFGPWFRPTLVGMEKPFKWDVMLTPKNSTTKQRASVAYTDMWGIYSKTKVPDQTWDFARYITSKEGQELWVKLIGARSISPIKEVAQSDAWLHYGGSSGELILEELTFSRVPPVNFANANEAETIWNTELGSVISGEKTVKQAVVDACKAIAPVLAGN